MTKNASNTRRQWEVTDRTVLEQHQLDRLNRLLAKILPVNRFYANKLVNCRIPLTRLDHLAEFPLTDQKELRNHDLPVNRTQPVVDYVRFHQTSGTHGSPLTVFDTAADWQWWINCWQYVLDAAEITSEDRAMLAFSFGPFIGFWSAHDALSARGTMTIPTGGMGTLARLALLRSSSATIVFCTPTYALRMAEVAQEQGIDLRSLPVRCLVVTGEPGGSMPAMRGRIEAFWNTQVIDHAGATEVGPWGYGDREGRVLYVLESEFIAEFLGVETGRPAVEGELAHLVLTTLGRSGCPVIRYRTGDLVRPHWSGPTPNRFVRLAGGVLGRSDDMMVIRGVNVYPSAIEQILHGFPEVVEYRLTASRTSSLDKLTIQVEDQLNQPERIAEELRIRLGLNIAVTVVAPMTLARSEEGKGKRFVDQRRKALTR